MIDCLPATHFDVILNIAGQVGIDETAFTRHYRDGSAEEALEKDLQLTRRLGIHALPAYLIQHRGRAVILQSFDYQDFINAISELTA